MFMVVDAWAWPSLLDTVRTSCLLAISKVAEVCRRPWNGIAGSCLSAFLSALYRAMVSWNAEYGVE